MGLSVFSFKPGWLLFVGTGGKEKRLGGGCQVNAAHHKQPAHSSHTGSILLASSS